MASTIQANPMVFPEAWFEIPPFPAAIKKIIEPRDLRSSRLPPPGYDMRTLRKQVDSLHQEIENRTESQEQMYSQNIVLWEYLKTLFKVNKSNAEKLQTYFKTLHSELLHIHKERHKLAQRLKMAQNAERVMKALTEEQQLELRGCVNEEQLKIEAEAMLTR